MKQVNIKIHFSRSDQLGRERSTGISSPISHGTAPTGMLWKPNAEWGGGRAQQAVTQQQAAEPKLLLGWSCWGLGQQSHRYPKGSKRLKWLCNSSHIWNFLAKRDFRVLDKKEQKWKKGFGFSMKTHTHTHAYTQHLLRFEDSEFTVPGSSDKLIFRLKSLLL